MKLILTDAELNNIYSLLLESLNLSERHTANLEARGLNADQIKLLNYKTFPNRRTTLIEKITKKINPLGVPGFWRNAGGNWQLTGKAGILVPIRNKVGEITALKIRLDNPKANVKYIYLSSNPKTNSDGNIKYPSGTAVKLSTHYPNLDRTPTIRITEGEIKADIASLLSNIYTISIPGIQSWRSAVEEVVKLKPKKVLLAFDSDKDKEVNNYTGAQSFLVGKTLAQLYLALKDLCEVKIETWPHNCGKGIDDVLADGYSDKITTMNKKEVSEFCEKVLESDMPLDWVYVIGIKRFINTNTLQELDKEQFSDKFAFEFSKKNAASAVIHHPSFPKVDYPIYSPANPQIIKRDGNSYLNLWKRHKLEATAGDATPFINHLKYLTNNSDELKILLSFLAFQIQNAGQKINWALLLQGKQGIGKSYIAHAMRKLLGDQNISLPSNEALHENFTGWQKSCQLIIVEEIMARGRLELMNKLKPMITEPIATIREMWKPPYQQPNTFNLLLFTNHKDAIIIDEWDRRYCIIFSDAKPLEENYYKELWGWTDENAGVILGYLESFNLEKFNPYAHAPKTEGKTELIKDSQPPLQAWIADGIELETWPFHSDLITINHLMECLPNYLKGTNQLLLIKYLKLCGAVELRKVKTDGGWIRPLAIRRQEMWAQATDEKLSSEYEKWSMEREPATNPILDAKPL